MVVRDTYRELWAYLRREWLDPADGPRESGATIVYSVNEFDKRHAIHYVLAAAAEARIPFVFHCTRTPFACVCIDAGVFYVPAINAGALEFTPNALLIIDAANRVTSPTVWGVAGAHVVVAARYRDRTLGRYKMLEKFRRARYYDLAALDTGRELGYVIYHLQDVVLGKTVSVIETGTLDTDGSATVSDAQGDSASAEDSEESTPAV